MILQKANFKTALLNSPDWRRLPGDLYEVHWRGVVRNAETKLNLRPGLGGAGYLTVALNHKTFPVHRLNAINFIPNPGNKRCVNHKDGIKINNHIANLEWNTHVENNAHATKIGLRKIRMTDDIIKKILSLYIKADKIYGAKALSKMFGFNSCTISETIKKYKHGNN